MNQINAKQSTPLSNIKSIEQSLMLLKHKISQMSKKQSQNIQQIQKVFHSSIPILKTKLSQSLLYQKIKQKKHNNFNEKILKQKMDLNRQRKLINQKQIQRNRQLITIMKMNQRNSIKQLSKKNQVYIQKMKNQRLQENKRKKQFIKGKIQNSRMKISNFHQSKLQELKRQKDQEIISIQRKTNKMMVDLQRLNNKQNQTIQKVQKSNFALSQLRFGINKLQKMNETQFIKLRDKAKKQFDCDNQDKLIQKLLTLVIQNSKQRRFYTSASKWNSGHQGHQQKSA